MERKSWDEYFLDIAKSVAERGTCDRLKVGCVLVKDRKIISTGYNGSIKGHKHCSEVGHLYNDQGRCIRTIHAEQNALIFAKEDLEGCTAYITHEPCETCTKLLVQAGISKIIYSNKYGNKYNIEFTHSIDFIHYNIHTNEDTTN